MEHVGIDLGGSKSQVCVRSPDGQILEERMVSTRSLISYLKKRSHGRVIIETCAESFALADKILELGHEVRVVPATLAKTLGIGSRGVKNDVKDARTLSEVSTRIDLPSVHIPSAGSRMAKSLCSCRDGVVRSRTKLINVVRGWMRTQLLSIPSGSTDTFAERLRACFVDPTGTALPDFISTTLVAIDSLTAQLKLMEKHLEDFVSSNETCQLLMTAPIGPVTAVRFVAAIDEIQRFRSGESVANYLGLTPGEHRSCLRGHRTGITKAGPTAPRSCLIQCAWSVWRSPKHRSLKDWAEQIYLRSGRKHVAIVALARKLSVILFAMWRDHTEYVPRELSGRNAAL